MTSELFWRFGEHEVAARFRFGARWTVFHDGHPQGEIRAFMRAGELEFVSSEDGQEVRYRLRIQSGPYGATTANIWRNGVLVAGVRPARPAQDV